jgi:hypothetical protein
MPPMEKIRKIAQRASRITLSIVLVSTCIACVGILGADRAEAADTVMQPDATGHIRIDGQVFVGAKDTVSIPAGTTVDFGSSGMIIVKGKLNIGMDGYHSDPAQNSADILRGVSMTYGGSISPISADGGFVIMFNVNFTGTTLLSAFRGAIVAISSSTLVSTLPIELMNVYLSAYLDIFSSIIRNIPFSQSETSSVSSASLIRIYSNAQATVTASMIQSPRTKNSFSIYNGARLHLDDSFISNCHTGITTYHLTTVEGQGNRITCDETEFVAYDGAMVNLTARPAKTCCSRVVFVPGLGGSRLYALSFGILGTILGKLFENQLWEPNRPDDVRKLFMNADGIPINGNVYTRDIIERTNIAGNVFSKSIYGGFVAYLRKLESEKRIDGYRVFPYDWRSDPDSLIVANLVLEIEDQARLASDGRVVLIAHSYGGFLAKSALSVIDADHKKDIIKAVIYTAVPETGSVQALFAGLHGDDQTILFGFSLDAATAIRLAGNMPSAHFVTPSPYFSTPIDLQFIDKKSGSITKYAKPTMSADAYSLPRVYEWIRDRMRKADADAGQLAESPAIKKLPAPPSSMLAAKMSLSKQISYEHSEYLEDIFSSYSIIGLGLPTPIGMRYEYAPCIPALKKFALALLSQNCLSGSNMNRITSYSKTGDGTVIFDGKDRRSGRDVLLSLADYNLKNKTSISHIDIMESKDVQDVISKIVTATSAATSTGPYGNNSSGTGPSALNPDNPWLNTKRVFGLHITGFVDGSVKTADAPTVSGSQAIAMPPISIVTTDHLNRIQQISALPEALAVTTVSRSDQGWSFGSALPYEKAELHSLENQNVTISMSESSELSASTGEVETTVTESFSDIPVGFGSVMALDTQYVTPTPSHTLTLDIDGDGMSDMTIPPDQTITGKEGSPSDGQSAGSSGNSSGTTSQPLSPSQAYVKNKTNALDAIRNAKISSERLEIYALSHMSQAGLNMAEMYIRMGNPSFALLSIKKKQARFDAMAVQYASTLDRLRSGLLSGILSGFRTPHDRLMREQEMTKAGIYVRDLARLRVILYEAEQKIIALLI